jgi:hypothetical protein
VTWATAVGALGIGGALTVLAVAFVWLVRKCLDLGDETNTSHRAQLDAEHFKREAEDQRDEATARAVKAENERDAALRQLAAARAAAVVVIDKRKEELQEQIDAGEDDDLVALSKRVFGNALSKASPAGEPAAEDSGGGTDTLPLRRPTI